MVRSVSDLISPAQAAARSGVSRWTIVRALKSNQIKGHRNNQGHWKIDSDSLSDWVKKQDVTAHSEHEHRAHVSTAHHDSIEAATLRVEVEMLRERIENDHVKAEEMVSELRSQIQKTESRERELRQEITELRRRSWVKPSWWP
jgi:excisionase family DNA binding protein